MQTSNGGNAANRIVAHVRNSKHVPKASLRLRKFEIRISKHVPKASLRENKFEYQTEIRSTNIEIRAEGIPSGNQIRMSNSPSTKRVFRISSASGGFVVRACLVRLRWICASGFVLVSDFVRLRRIRISSFLLRDLMLGHWSLCKPLRSELRFACYRG